MKAVIIQTAFIGDVILCTPVIDALVNSGAEVGFVAKPEAAALFENDSRIRRLHVFDKRGADSGVTGIARIGKELKSIEYDCAIVPHRSIRSAVAAYLASIPKRVGFDRSAGKMLFTDVVTYDRESHEIERNCSLLDAAGIPAEPVPPRLVVAQSEEESVRRQFGKWNIPADTPVIGFGPGSKWFTKQWGTDRYRKLAKLLLNSLNCRIVCFGGPDEKELCGSICEADESRVLNAAGVFSLKESAAALRGCAAAVANDNGLMHIAESVDVPVVALFGPTVPAFGFAPWDIKHTVLGIELYCRPCRIHGSESCPEQHFECMGKLFPETVRDAVLKYLRN